MTIGISRLELGRASPIDIERGKLLSAMTSLSLLLSSLFRFLLCWDEKIIGEPSKDWDHPISEELLNFILTLGLLALPRTYSLG